MNDIYLIPQLTNEDLQQRRANALSTSCCGGHYKGERNDTLVRKYDEELEARGVVAILSFDDGVFNGPGSY